MEQRVTRALYTPLLHHSSKRLWQTAKQSGAQISRIGPSGIGRQHYFTRDLVVQATPIPEETRNTEGMKETSIFDELVRGTERRYIMISGKGGVGKTTLAASLAVKLAECGHTTLVVSTDPAHSLGDSLNQDLSGGKLVAVQGTALPLWGMEIDPDEAKREFRRYTQSERGQSMKDRAKGIANKVGFGIEDLADLKLDELLDSPPPGLDEAMALSKVVQFVSKEEYERFSRIVFDTAPTGHTLRMLSLPDFVGGSLTKLMKLRRNLRGITGTIASALGETDDVDSSLDALESLVEGVESVKLLFQNPNTTEFIIAAIPTVLAINESRRLLKSLQQQRIPCSKMIVNQTITETMTEAYLKLRLKDQNQSLDYIKRSKPLSELMLLVSPLLDAEVRGVPGLQYFGQKLWNPVFREMKQTMETRYTLVGGKGGVGKTTTAAALAVNYALAGLPTLVVSTDPAHSLSDALDQDVSGGVPVVVTGAAPNELYGMEIDIQKARQEIKEAASTGGMLDDLGIGGVAQQLNDLNLAELLENPPPGIDEAVAVSQVVQFMKDPKYAKFKRIVFDTAPTGHTLRLLTLPDFLEMTIGKIVKLRSRLDSAMKLVRGVLGGDKKKSTESAIDKLETLKAGMEEARELFRDNQRTDFVIVTIPTMMAALESERLAKSLSKENIPAKYLVANQVILPSASTEFMERRKKEQQRALNSLRHDPAFSGIRIEMAPMVDLEIRGVPALQYFATLIWKS